MNRDELLRRRADLARQLGEAKAKQRDFEGQLRDAQRLVETIDGALQENAYWLDVAGIPADAEAAGGE